MEVRDGGHLAIVGWEGVGSVWVGGWVWVGGGA